MIVIGMKGVHWDYCPSCYGAGSSGVMPWFNACQTCRTWGIVPLPGASFDIKTKDPIYPKEAA